MPEIIWGEGARSQGDCNELFCLIKEETRLHKKLLDLARREQELLVSGNLDELSPIIAKLESVVTNIADIEQARIRLMSEISSSDPAFSTCIEAMKDMEPILDEVARVNEENRFLINNSLDYVTFVKNISDEFTGKGTYSAPNGMVN